MAGEEQRCSRVQTEPSLHRLHTKTKSHAKHHQL